MFGHLNTDTRIIRTPWQFPLVSVLHKGGFIIYTEGGGGAMIILTGDHDFSAVGFKGGGGYGKSPPT